MSNDEFKEILVRKLNRKRTEEHSRSKIENRHGKFGKTGLNN